MSDWNQFLEEEVSDQHREAVFRATGPALKEMRAGERRGFLWKSLSLGLSAAGAVFGVIMATRKMPGPKAAGESPEILLGMELLKNQDDLDTIAEMDLLEDLEVLEKWEPS